MNFILRLLQWHRKLFYRALSTGHTRGRVQIFQPVLILGNGNIEFETNVKLGFFPSPFFLSGYIHIEARNKDSFIRFGEDTYVNNNFAAVAEHTGISIGKRCFLGTNVEIYDSDFHGLKITERRASEPNKARPVLIGDDVFIGSNVKIMKGTEIGNGSVIANGSIVVDKIPSNVIAGGNPAKILRAIEV